MASDLTERLAAKLWDQTHFSETECEELARNVGVVLPLLLSEPELVAGLPEAVRLSVLTERERAVMKLGEAELLAMAARNEAEEKAAVTVHRAALAEARAMTQEAKNG